MGATQEIQPDNVPAESLLGQLIRSIKARGQHGIESYPPLEQIKATLEEWLLSLLDQTARFQADVEVECRRIPRHGNWFGVKVRNFETHNHSSVETRVSVRGNPWQWCCHLICDDEDSARLITQRARPVAFAFSERMTVAIDQSRSETAKQPRFMVERQMPRVKRIEGTILNKFHFLTQRATLRTCCYRLRERAGDQSQLDPKVVLEVISKLIKYGDDDFNRLAVWKLVNEGLIDPVDATGESFILTIIGEEYADAEARRLACEERLGQERRLAYLNRTLSSAERESKRRMEAFFTQCELLRDIRQEIEGLKATLAEPLPQNGDDV